MTFHVADLPTPTLDLPPVYSAVIVRKPANAFAHACGLAGPDRAGTLVWVERDEVIEFAVVLAPDEPLTSARRAFFVAMTALADAVSAHAPPEKPVTFDWPDAIRFDGARIGGGRLGWPDDCPEDRVPGWLVYSAMLIASKQRAGDPGLTPDSTSLEEEGFLIERPGALVESFARYLMKGFDLWAEQGFESIEARYLAHLPNGESSLGAAPRRPLLAALRAVSWLDPATGAPRL